MFWPVGWTCSPASPRVTSSTNWRRQLVGADVPLKHISAHRDRGPLLGRRRLRRERNCRVQEVHANVVGALAGAVGHHDDADVARRGESDEGAVAACAAVVPDDRVAKAWLLSQLSPITSCRGPAGARSVCANAIAFSIAPRSGCTFAADELDMSIVVDRIAPHRPASAGPNSDVTDPCSSWPSARCAFIHGVSAIAVLRHPERLPHALALHLLVAISPSRARARARAVRRRDSSTRIARRGRA